MQLYAWGDGGHIGHWVCDTTHTHTHIGFPCIMGTFHQHNIDIIQYKLYILAPKSIPKTHTHKKKKHSRLFPHK